MNILVIGGAGYIGSHTVIELINAGFSPVVLDNFSGSSSEAFVCIKDVTGKEVPLVIGDFADTKLLRKTIKAYSVSGVIHFAAFKAVGESVEHPLKYYRNNVSGFVDLVDVLAQKNIPLVFSSSAAVYGQLTTDSADEETVCSPTSPYGWSKLMGEVVLRDTCGSGATMRSIALRYFNVVGAHGSGKIGEMPKLPPQNLLPLIVESAAKIRPSLTVYGTDYDTPDGTCLRDYIHVTDLAKAHIAALNHLLKAPSGYYEVFNVGTGIPTSVLELIHAFETVNHIKVPYTLDVRRSGDVRSCYAKTNKIKDVLGWKAEKTFTQACADAWRWQLHRPVAMANS